MPEEKKEKAQENTGSDGGRAGPMTSTVQIEDEMRSAYLDYAMSVIVGRALPDVRDGLKPVQRRILYAMFREGLLSNRRYSKCAGVVGEVIKKYHPHGDTAVYDALVRLAKDFNMRYPLVYGQGNFGSVDGDPPAAYRYTEARLAKIAEEMLSDIDMDTVDFVPNFDESVMEPTVLPTRTPSLLMNGSAGIAVGMATNIPPHNLKELIDGLVLLLENPEATFDEIVNIIHGPDFPTGAFIYGPGGISEAYRTGRGSLTLRARAAVEVHEKSERESIIVTELPYQVNKARLIEKIAELVRDGKVEGVADLRDESDRDGMRIAIELKRGTIAAVVLNQLYKHTELQKNFGVIMLALVQNQPVVLTLQQILQHFIDYRCEVVIRRARFELKQAQERAHILEGLKKALDNLDAVIALIKRSANPEEARQGLMRRYAMSTIQAQAVLDMKLQRLTSLEREKLVAEYRDILQLTERLRALLASEALVRNLIKEELLAVKEKYGDERRTEILPEAQEISIEDMIAPEEVIITITHSGYIKRSPVSVYRAQRRGGKGKIGMGTKEEDFVEHLYQVSTKDYLLFFTDQGRVLWLKVYQIPEVGRAAKGKALVNLLSISQDRESPEEITAILNVERFHEGAFTLMATKNGIVKKTSLVAYSNPRAGGIRALNLEEGDRLIGVALTSGRYDILLATKKGFSIRFKEDQVRPIGRTATGVRGIRLREGDEVMSMAAFDPSAGLSILTVTERGYGKRTGISEYRRQGRGGSGIITIRTGERNGDVVATLGVLGDSEVMIVTAKGKIIRLAVSGIRVIGRNTQGVRLMGMEPEDRIVGMAMLAEKEREEAEAAEPTNGSPAGA